MIKDDSLIIRRNIARLLQRIPSVGKRDNERHRDLLGANNTACCVENAPTRRTLTVLESRDDFSILSDLELIARYFLISSTKVSFYASCYDFSFQILLRKLIISHSTTLYRL